jgi:hypothetical protein
MVVTKEFKDNTETDIIAQNLTQCPYVFNLSSFAGTLDHRVDMLFTVCLSS